MWTQAETYLRITILLALIVIGLDLMVWRP